MVEYPLSSTTANEAIPASENKSPKFATRVLPWVLAGVMLGIYGWTLNPWLSADSLPLVARLDKMTWVPALTAPVSFLILWPFGWLPAHWVPPAVNVFTAVCAAAGLGLLARCVALLPHDLSQVAPPKRRGYTPPNLMPPKTAWLPPLFAVLACGLELSFWQNSIAATSQIIDLLLFAYIIRCLFEFNADQRASWLLQGAAVYGLAVANEPFAAAFAPALIVALIWTTRLYAIDQRSLEKILRRRETLDLRLFWQIPMFWLAGFSLVLLLPALAVFSKTAHLDFWTTLEFNLRNYKMILHLPRSFVITSCLICIMPVFLIGLRSYHFFSGSNRVHVYISTAFVQMVYGFFLLVGLWTLFDTPLSPHQQAPAINTLPLYFLLAISIGFFVGHFLLMADSQEEVVASERRRSSKERRRGKSPLKSLLAYSCLAGIGMLALGIPIALVVRNLPKIDHARTSPFATYIHQVETALPVGGAVILGNNSFQMAWLEADLPRHHRAADYLFINIEPLVQTNYEYLTFLQEQKKAGFNLAVKLPDVSASGRRILLPVTLVQQLEKSHPIFWLPPVPLESAVAELFYFEPQTLVYRGRQFPGDNPFAAPLSQEGRRANESFWQDFRAQQLPELARQINPPARQPASGMVQRFANTLKSWPEPDRDAAIAGVYYGEALNDWGVALQRRGDWAGAGECFAEAVQLNPRNASAQINQQFNADYRAKKEITIQKPLDTALSMNKYRDWQHVLADGAVDEPSFCYLLGVSLAENNLFRPAIAQFERVKELAPSHLETSVNLARLFVECRDMTNALKSADDILALSPTNDVGLFVKANSFIRAEKFSAAIPLLTQLLEQNPTNTLARLNRAIALRNSYLFDAARRDYNAVLQIQPDSFPAYYDLAQMDDTEENRQAAITNYELFLKYAPTNFVEVAQAQTRLKELQSSEKAPALGPVK